MTTFGVNLIRNIESANRGQACDGTDHIDMKTYLFCRNGLCRFHMAGVKPLQVQRKYLGVVSDKIDDKFLRFFPVSLHRVTKEQRAACNERFMDGKFLLRVALTNHNGDDGGTKPGRESATNAGLARGEVSYLRWCFLASMTIIERSSFRA